ATFPRGFAVAGAAHPAVRQALGIACSRPVRWLTTVARRISTPIRTTAEPARERAPMRTRRVGRALRGCATRPAGTGSETALSPLLRHRTTAAKPFSHPTPRTAAPADAPARHLAPAAPAAA